MIKVALVVGTYTGGGIGVVVGSLVKEALRFGVKYTIVTKKSLAKSKDAKIIEFPAHSSAMLNALKGFDVVHVMGGSTLVVPALLSKKPSVFTFQGQTPPSMHGGAVKNAKAYAIEALYKATMSRFDVITCAAKFGQEDVRKRYGVNHSIWIPNGVDRKLFHKAKNQKIVKIGKLHGHPLFLGVGNLYPVKGWMEMLGWFEDYLSDKPKAHLMIAGTGTLESEMRRKIEGGKLLGHVDILGEIPLEKLNDYYNACDAFVSGSPYEGFCLPAIEALACGKPLVVRKRGAMIEHALKSGCGKVFDDNSESFKRAANEALKLKSAHIKEHSKEYLEPFNWKNAAHQYSKIYEKLLEEKQK
ncbi:MAG: glycosyltransferase [Candidatus Micrarchaeota archaeon]